MIRIGSREFAVESDASTLRAAMVLACATGRSFRWERFRRKEGLRPGELETIRVFADLLGLRTDAALASETFDLEPGDAPETPPRVELSADRSMFPTVRDAVAALALIRGTAETVFAGSTHAPGGDTFEVTRSTWCALLRFVGIDVKLTLDCAGFAPRGGGELTARVEAPPRTTWCALALPAREALNGLQILSSGASLPAHVQQRQAARARSGLAISGLEPTVQLLKLRARGGGSVVSITGFFGPLPLTVAAVSERGKSAEAVGEDAAALFRRILRHGASVPERLIDSLLLAMAFVPGESLVTTPRSSAGLAGRIALIEAFTGRNVEVAPGAEGPVRIRLW